MKKNILDEWLFWTGLVLRILFWCYVIVSVGAFTGYLLS
jgi:hypothetical protein